MNMHVYNVFVVCACMHIHTWVCTHIHSRQEELAAVSSKIVYQENMMHSIDNLDDWSEEQKRDAHAESLNSFRQHTASRAAARSRIKELETRLTRLQELRESKSEFLRGYLSRRASFALGARLPSGTRREVSPLTFFLWQPSGKA